MSTTSQEPLIVGIQAAMIGVSDFVPHLDIFCDGLGWTVIAEGTIEQAVCEHLWNAKSLAEVKVLTAGNAPTGRIHLLKFPDLYPEAVGLPAARTFGHHGLNVYVRDMAEMQERLLAHGAQFVGEAKYSLTAQDGSSQTVHQIKMECMDGVGIVFVNPDTPRFTHAWQEDESVFCTELTSVVILIPDVDASRAFWGPDGLGLTFHYDGVMQNEKAASMTGRAPDEKSHLLFGFGTETARVELAGRADDRYAALSRDDLTVQQHPGRGLGEMGWVICVDELASALDLMERQGGSVTAPPIDLDTPILGKRRAATLQTPENTCLTVWERIQN